VKKLFAVLVIGSLTIVGCEKPASTKAPVKPMTPAPGASSKDEAEKSRMIKEAADKAKADSEKKTDAEKKAPDLKDAAKDTSKDSKDGKKDK